MDVGKRRGACADAGPCKGFRSSSGPGTRRNIRKNYAKYVFAAPECIKYLMLYLLLDLCISYLFFRSAIAFLLLLPGMALFWREQQKTLQSRQKKELIRQFMEGIQLMEASLQAGYSAENALCEALKELRKTHEEGAAIVQEFSVIETQLQMNRNLEELLLDFGRRSDVPDILSFAEVFATAKRTGGELPAIIRNTASCIRQKQETMQEIETCLAGKAMEQNIMSAVPLLILGYIRLTSPEFLDVMYETAAGAVVMTLSFLVYVLAYFWGKHIVHIRV